MTFTFAQPLKLLSIGGSLITSSSFWFFNPTSAPSTSQSKNQSSQKSSSAVGDPNINSYDAEDKLPNRNGQVKVDPKIENKKFNTPYLHFNIKGETIQRILSKINFPELDHLNLKNVLGKRSFYEALDKKSIKIHLFKTAAWYSSTGNEEFQDPLSDEEIDELFKDLDETKTKQLLLSLQKRRK